jgi:archaellum component FlaC
MILRTFQASSTFISVFLKISCLLTLYASVPYATVLIAATSSALVGTIVVSFIINKKLTRLGFEETYEYWNLRDKIKKDVEKVLLSAVEQLRKDAQSMKENVTSESMGWHVKVEKLIEENKALLMSIDNMLKKVNTMVEGYNMVIKNYRQEMESLEHTYKEEMQRYEDIIAKYQQLMYLEEELRRIIDQVAPMEPSRRIELVKHGEDLVEGLASRRKGAEVRKSVAEVLRSMGFEVELGGGASPDMLLTYNKIRAAVVASAAFTLTKDGIRQRRIPITAIAPEVQAAERLALPLTVVVTNIANQRMYGLFIPTDKLPDLKRGGGITTPMALVEEGAKAERECEESIKSLKEKILAEIRKRVEVK